jgi:hypothetical protein
MFRNALGRKSAMMILAASLAVFGGACTASADHNSEPAQPAAAAMKMDAHTTSQFAGPKANTGTATLKTENGQRTLTWSDDFTIPQTPAPHWQVVDSSGNTYLLQRLVIKGDKQNRTIVVPSYVKDVAKVQIWCAYAEVVLGEASFPAMK